MSKLDYYVLPKFTEALGHLHPRLKTMNFPVLAITDTSGSIILLDRTDVEKIFGAYIEVLAVQKEE